MYSVYNLIMITFKWEHKTIMIMCLEVIMINL